MQKKDANESNRDDCWRCAADDADEEWVEQQDKVRSEVRCGKRKMAASKEDETTRTDESVVSIA